MLEDSGAASVITDTRGAAALSVLGSLLPVLRVDAPESGAAPAAPAPVDPDQLAYVIYTSGSTGKPKGVMIRHRSAAALVEWAARHFPEAADPGRAVLAATSICFDLSVFELFVPLALGGVVALAENALHLGALAARVPVALVNTVPSALAELVRGGELPASVVTVNLAGEPLEQGLVEAIYRSGPRVGRVVNLYGPSEDTTYSTWAVIAAGETPTIGRPVAATRAYVLDAGGRAVPPGSVGELCLAGIGLARGYLRRPGLSAERFVPDRLGERASPGGRLYRTGDLARQLPDGRLCFLGRRDHQVKLRGFRIELGEIEATLRRHPAVAQAVVQAVVQALVGVRPVSDGGDPRLVAWVVPATDEAPDPTALRGWLGQRLPAYMVPAAIVPLAALPLSANGKIDRGALPEPGAPTSTQLYEAPRNALERKVAAVWAAVLGVERVGIHDNFFDLGGHSLLMVRAHQRLQEELGRELALIANFAHPTVAALAAFLGGATDEPEARRAGEQRGARRRDAAAARRAQRPAGDQNR